MTTITIADLATAPQIDSRRVARDLIEWLADRGWVIVRPAPTTAAEPLPPVADNVYESTTTVCESRSYCATNSYG